MRKSTKKRLLAFFLAGMVSFGTFPGAAFAEGKGKDKNETKVEQQLPADNEETSQQSQDETKVPEEPVLEETTETITEMQEKTETEGVEASEEGIDKIEEEAVEKTMDEPATFAVGDVYYEKVSNIDSTTAEYLLVYENGNTKVALNNVGASNNATLLTISATDTNNLYTIENVTNKELWKFNKPITSTATSIPNGTSGVKITSVDSNNKLEVNNGSISLNENGDSLTVGLKDGKASIAYDYSYLSTRTNYLIYDAAKFTGTQKWSDNFSNATSLTMYKKVEKVSLTANFYLDNQLLNDGSYSREVINKTTQTIVKPDSLNVANIQFVNMKVNEVSSDSENLNVFIDGNTTVNYYYKTKQMYDVTVEFYVDNKLADGYPQIESVEEGTTYTVTEPAGYSDYIFVNMVTNNGEPSTEKNFSVTVNGATAVKYYYTDTSSGTAGDIKLNKTATNERKSADGRGYLYDINLSVQGKEITKNNPVDVTLILDVSNSMTKDGSKNLANTKKAAEEFITNVLPAGNKNARVSLVKYGTNAKIYNFTTKSWVNYTSVTSGSSADNYYTYTGSDANNVVQALDVDGGTNTEEGLMAAKNVTDIRNRTTAKSMVIFMTDGVPTFSKGNTDNNGSDTSVSEFNAAVTAGVALKNAGNDVYTIGLLAGVSEQKELIADYLLSSTYKYTCTGSGSSIQDLDMTTLRGKFTTSTPPYSSGYYKVTSIATAESEMEKIYKDLASKALSLASGTVTDIIPPEFKLTAESRAQLEKVATITDNPNGSTTIVFNNSVSAGKEVVNIPTFTIEPNTNAYGSKFTNVEAAYAYTLYDGKIGTLTFDKPHGFITPLTKNDEYYTTVNTNYTISDVLANDPSYVAGALKEAGYDVSGLTYRLVSADGNEFTGIPEATINTNADGTFNFISSKEGTYEFYYVAEGVATKGEESKTLTSKPTLVTVHVYAVYNKTFVIDYGKPVTYAANKVFDSVFETAADTTITLKDRTGTCGNVTLNEGNSITYTLNKFMDSIDNFAFGISNKKVASTLDKTVTMIPATTVYYEDNFSAIEYGEGWQIATSAGADNAQNGDGAYGNDSSYGDDTMYSNGSAHYIKATTGKNVDASFTFTGTGFDLISKTSGNSGAIGVKIYDQSGKQVKQGMVDTTWHNTVDGVILDGIPDTLYQIPVITFKDLPHGTYTVKITVFGPLDANVDEYFYLDAIRIYNPLGDLENQAYKDDNEAYPEYYELRDMLIDGSKLGLEANMESVVFVEGNKTADITALTNSGPNNEVYLAKDQGISFYLEGDANIADVQLGVKSLDGSEVKVNIKTDYTLNGEQKSNTNTISSKTSTDMFYSIYNNEIGSVKKLYTIVNPLDSIVSLTSSKITYAEKPAITQNGKAYFMVDSSINDYFESLNKNLEIASATISNKTILAGTSFKLTVKASEEVDSIEIVDQHGKVITPVKVTSKVNKRASDSEKKTFTITLRESRAGDKAYTVTGLSNDGLRSKNPVKISFKVKNLWNLFW